MSDTTLTVSVQTSGSQLQGSRECDHETNPFRSFSRRRMYRFTTGSSLFIIRFLFLGGDAR